MFDTGLIKIILIGLTVLGSLGGLVFVYLKGKKDQKSEQQEKTLESLEEQRKDAAKPTPSTSTVRKRMRDGDF